ncbi:MAG: hypothetical protein ACYSOZ_06820 [Planctomycetota bacterium]
MTQTQFITDRQIYEQVLQEQVPNAEDFVWIGTSDIKDLHVDSKGTMVPFLKVLSGLIKRQVSIRLIHAKEPGKPFRDDFDKHPNLITGMERLLCPRVHFGRQEPEAAQFRIRYCHHGSKTGRADYGAVRCPLAGRVLPGLPAKRFLFRLQGYFRVVYGTTFYIVD